MMKSLRPLWLCLGGGVLMSVAATPLHLWGLAWVAVVPLWVLVRQATSRRQRLLGAIAWGFGYHGLTLSWILGLHPLTWMGVPWLGSIAIALFCWLFITAWGTAANLVWAVGLAASDRLGTGTPTPRLSQRLITVLIGTALWIGLEWLLNLTPLSWTALAFTQSPGNPAILHLGQWSGPSLVSALIVAVNGLLAEAWLLSWQRQVSDRPIIRALIAIALVLGSSGHAIGWGMMQQPLGDRPDQALTIGIVQSNIPTREKLSADGVRRAIRNYVGGYEILAAQGVDAVLTPEGAFPFLWDAARNPFRAAVQAQQVPAWLGSFVADDGNITQSLLSLDRTGAVVGRYNKIKLVPLGEYIPFQEVLGGLIGRLSPIKSSMVPGEMGQILATPFGQAIASICYESVFPDLFRQQAAQGGEFILTASNLDPYSEVLMQQHQAQDLLRAIETDRWAARATNTGYSGFIDPHGRIIARSQPNVEQLLKATLYRRQTQTLYVRWGDWLTPLLAGWGLLALVVRRSKML